LDEPIRRQAVRILFQAYLEERTRGNANEQGPQQNLAISMFGCGNCFLEFLAAELTNAQPRVREQAASLVGYESGMPTNFIGALGKMLSDEAPGVRWQAVASLSRFRKHSTMIVPLLTKALQDRESSVRREAVEYLHRFGPQARPALVELLALAERDPENRQSVVDCVHDIDWAEGERLASKLAIPTRPP
jgi:hypothetical protein